MFLPKLTLSVDRDSLTTGVLVTIFVIVLALWALWLTALVWGIIITYNWWLQGQEPTLFEFVVLVILVLGLLPSDRSSSNDD